MKEKGQGWGRSHGGRVRLGRDGRRRGFVRMCSAASGVAAAWEAVRRACCRCRCLCHGIVVMVMVMVMFIVVVVVVVIVIVAMACPPPSLPTSLLPASPQSSVGRFRDRSNRTGASSSDAPGLARSRLSAFAPSRRRRAGLLRRLQQDPRPLSRRCPLYSPLLPSPHLHGQTLIWMA